MKAFGNSNPQQCVANLINISRGEVPYDRLKGLTTKAVDIPGMYAKAELQADISWVLSTYEPRADIDEIDISNEILQNQK